MRHVRLALLGCLFVAFGACARPTTVQPPVHTMPRAFKIRLTDGLTGEPITRAAIVGYDTDECLAEATPSGYDFAPDGVFDLPVNPTTGSVRFAAEGGYSETWTERLPSLRGVGPVLDLEMMPLSRVIVTVLEADGSPVEKTTVHIVGRNRLRALPVSNGVADARLDAGEVEVRIDPRFTDDFRPQSRPITLRPGETTRLTLRVERP